jgi:hypothetical protein
MDMEGVSEGESEMKDVVIEEVQPKKTESVVKKMLLKHRGASSTGIKKSVVETIRIRNEVILPSSSFLFKLVQQGYTTNVREQEIQVDKGDKKMKVLKYVKDTFVVADTEEVHNEEWVFVDQIASTYVPILDMRPGELEDEKNVFVGDLLKTNTPPECVEISSILTRQTWFSEMEFTPEEEFVLTGEIVDTNSKGEVTKIKIFKTVEDKTKFTTNAKGEKRKLRHYTLKDDFKVDGISFKDAENYALKPLAEDDILDEYLWVPPKPTVSGNNDVAVSKKKTAVDTKNGKEGDSIHDWDSLSLTEKSKTFKHIRDENEKLKKIRLQFNYIEYADHKFKNRYDWALKRIKELEAELPSTLISEEEEEEEGGDKGVEDKIKVMRNDVNSYYAFLSKVRVDRMQFHKDIFEEDVLTRRIIKSLVEMIARANKGGKKKITPLCQMDIAKIKRLVREYAERGREKRRDLEQELLEKEMNENAAYDEKLRQKKAGKSGPKLTEQEAFAAEEERKEKAAKMPTEPAKPPRRATTMFVRNLDGSIPGSTSIQTKLPVSTEKVVDDPNVVSL